MSDDEGRRDRGGRLRPERDRSPARSGADRGEASPLATARTATAASQPRARSDRSVVTVFVADIPPAGETLACH